MVTPRKPGARGRKLWPLTGLASARASAGMTQMHLHERAGLTREHISRLERLASFATTVTRWRLALVVGAAPDDLSGHCPPSWHREHL